MLPEFDDDYAFKVFACFWKCGWCGTWMIRLTPDWALALLPPPETHLNGTTLRLEEVWRCRESMLHSGPTEIQITWYPNKHMVNTSYIQHQRLCHRSPKGADCGCSVFGEKTKSTITIQDKETDEQNPGYDQLWNNTRPRYENISVLNDPKLKMCIYSHSKAPMVHQVRLRAV